MRRRNRKDYWEISVTEVYKSNKEERIQEAYNLFAPEIKKSKPIKKQEQKKNESKCRPLLQGLK
jgi:hypothetical protein